MATPFSNTIDKEALQQRASEVGSELLERANEAGSTGMNVLADQLLKAGEYVETRASDLAEQYQVQITQEQVALVTDRIVTAADYLRRKDPRAVAEDIDGGVRAHPWRSAAIGFGLGYIIARWF